jgi:hypothetical protein
MEPTSGLEPLACSLRVITQAWQGCAGGCKCRMFRRFSLPELAPCCTVLRSRWYQSGINRGMAASRSCSVVAFTCRTSSISQDRLESCLSSAATLAGWLRWVLCHRREHGQGVGLTRRRLALSEGATRKTCVLRSQSSVAVEHSRSCISTQHIKMYESVTRCIFALRSEPCGFEAPFSVHDTACRLPRISLPRTPVNSGAATFN